MRATYNYGGKFGGEYPESCEIDIICFDEGTYIETKTGYCIALLPDGRVARVYLKNNFGEVIFNDTKTI